MTQDELKKLVAQAAIDYVEVDTIIGVGTGSTANYFIDALAEIKHKIEGTVASSEASAPWVLSPISATAISPAMDAISSASANLDGRHSQAAGSTLIRHH